MPPLRAQASCRPFHRPGFLRHRGQGKTALYRELWRKTDPAAEPSYAFLRRAELDLHGRQKDDPDLLLVWIRDSFATAGVTCLPSIWRWP